MPDDGWPCDEISLPASAGWIITADMQSEHFDTTTQMPAQLGQ